MGGKTYSCKVKKYSIVTDMIYLLINNSIVSQYSKQTPYLLEFNCRSIYLVMERFMHAL